MELLAPAGSLEAFYAAINAGADAVYLGGKLFSARAYSTNFTNGEIKELIKYAHIRNVKVYITLNTLIFEDEFSSAVEFARFLYQNDVDALLIQDLGLAYYLHQEMPDLILHASTQLNCHNLIQAQSLIELGFKRLVLAREVSIEEAKEIKKLGVEVELFVHGALCVSYSGNCLMSSFIGGRSGNRGRCAQPCRHHVELLGDNNNSRKYALSTKDLMTLDYIEKYREVGIDSLKIEGRMKREEYVYQVISSYRKAIDQLSYNYSKEIYNIKKLFNRDFTRGYIFNESRTSLLNQSTPSNLGVKLGEIVKIKNNFVYVKLEDDVHVGDGIKFLNDKLDGMLLTRFSVNKKFVSSAKKGEIISFSRNNLMLKEKTIVNKTTDYLLNKSLDEKIKDKKLLPIHLKISGMVNQPLIIEIFDEKNNIVKVESSFLLEKAKNNPTTKERIISQLLKVDEYPFFFENINYQVDENIFIPISIINQLRREALDLISRKRENFNHYLGILNSYQCTLDQKQTNFQFVKVETLEQYKALVNEDELTLVNYDELKIDNKFKFLHRINHFDKNKLKEGEITSYYKQCQDLGLNIYSYYGNVTNSYTLDLLFKKGYQIVFLSLECSKRQISAIIDSFFQRHEFYPNIGLLVYGKVDYMIMKSCPIANMNNLKKDHCLLCKKNRYYLKDHMQVQFPLISDSQCMIRVISDRPISLLGRIEELKQLKINNFMIDFTIEDQEQVRKIVESFKNKQSLTCKDYLGHYNNEIE